jgi:hypothetical protein
MADNVVYLHNRPEPIGQYLRIGNSGYKQLETLFGSGQFHARKIVVDAAWCDAQKDLISLLQDAQIEIILDTNTAELSEIGSFRGACRNLPWAVDGRKLIPGDFDPLNI